jgi:precorrin-6B methylase 2
MKTTTLAVLCIGFTIGACSESATSSEVLEPKLSEATALTQSATSRTPDVVFVPTPQPVVDRMLELAQVREGDVLYDLGSGDGRIPITAAQKYGIRTVGIDIDPQRISESTENARRANVQGLVTFRQADLFESDISEASVVTLYLLNTLNLKLKPKLLAELKPGTRIVSHAFDMGDWKPERQEVVDGSSVYLWTVPEPGASAS